MKKHLYLFKSERRWRNGLAAVVAAGIVAALSLAFAHDEKTHWLEGRTLCVAPDSVLLTFNDVTPTRAQAARANTFSSLDGKLRNTLRQARVETDFKDSCQGSDSFVVVSVRVTFLDPNIYPSNRYGKQAFGLTLSVHTGQHADATYLAEHYVLPQQRFIAFDELAFSEVERGEGFERYVKDQAGAMIRELAAAWHEDNP